MVHAILTFDTLAYSKKLKQAGFTEQQAETLVETMAEILNNDLATNHDLQVTKHDLKLALRDMNHWFKHELEQFEFRLVWKLTIAIVIIYGFFTGLLLFLSN